MFDLGNLMAPPEVATARAQAGSFGSQLFRALFPAAQPALARTLAPALRPQIHSREGQPGRLTLRRPRLPV